MRRVRWILFLLLLAVQQVGEVSLVKTKNKGTFTNNEEGWLAFINKSEWYKTQSSSDAKLGRIVTTDFTRDLEPEIVVTYMMIAVVPDSTTGILVGMCDERTDKWTVAGEYQSNEFRLHMY